MKIGFKFGPDPNTSEPHLELGAMTLIVGPNGAGKSLLLRELCEEDNTSRYATASGPATRPHTKLLGCFHPTEPRTAEEGRWLSKVIHGLARRVDDFARYFMSDPPEQEMPAAAGANALLHGYLHLYCGRHEVSTRGPREQALTELRDFIEKGDGETSLAIARQLIDSERVLKSGVAGLSLRRSTLSTRIRALEPRKPVSPREATRHRLLRLLEDSERRGAVNRALAELAGFEIAIDASDLTLLRVVTYDAADGPAPESAPWSEESKRFFSRTRPLEERCDGDRSLAALVVESLLHDTDLLLLDEPEISLHPPLARQLGAFLTNLAEERGISIIAATHSPDFVAGCLSTRHPVSIGRLDYRDGRGSAQALSTELVSEMSTDPLLRSTGILGALFHKAALVCEGASDIALYAEISDRLSLREQDYPRVMRDTLMINANGRTSVPKIIAKLRAAGVHCACITDLDLLNVNNVLEALLRASDVHENLVQSLVAMSDQVSKIFSDRKPLLKQGGASSLPRKEAEVVKTFTDTLARFGIFVPENGALEQWLPQFTEIPRGKRNKANFIPSIFEAMGPTTTGLAPADGDIWAFMRRVAAWLADTTPTPPTDERSPDGAR